MLQEDIFGNILLLDNLSGADILANIAVLAYFGIDAGVSGFLVDGKVGTVGLAIAAKSASGGAILGLLLGSILGRACNHLYSLVRNNGYKLLWAGICTVAAANAFIGIDLCNAVHDGNSIIAANSNAFSVTKASGGTHSLVSQLELNTFRAGLNTKLVKNDCASAVAVATYKCNSTLELGKIMKLIYYDFFAALYGAGNTADTLVIINNSMVIDNRDSAFGTGSLALTAGNAAIAAGFPDDFIIFLGRRAGYEICSVSWNHADKPLGTHAFLGTITASIALFSVDDNFSVNKLHGPLCATEHTGTNAYTAVSALSPFEAHFKSFSAGLALCKTILAGGTSGAGNKSNLFLLLQSTIRSHEYPS